MLAKAKHSASAYQRETVPFLGLNRSDDTREGEFSGQKNMSDRRYPFLAPRLPRTKKVYTEPTALFAWNGKEIRAEGGILYYDGEALCNVLDGPKQFAVVNTKLVVWPDKMTVDLTNKVVKEMFATVTNSATATFTMNSITFDWKRVYATGKVKYKSNNTSGPWVWTYSDVKWTQDNGWELTDPQLLKLFGNNAEGRIYIPTVTWSESTKKYTYDLPQASSWADKKPTNYPEPEPANDLGFYAVLEVDDNVDNFIGIYGSQYGWITTCYWEQENNLPLSEVFSVGDAVTVSGVKEAYAKENIAIKSINSETNTLTFAANTFPGTMTDTGRVTVKREGPPLDYICEHENRLWGVSNRDKTIYASSLGVPERFFNYTGDSGGYAVAVGSEGDFTGICSYGNAVLCWKERTLHKVLGDLPSNYQTAVYRFAGVRAGAHKSLVNVNETLFFLGADGVYAYTGNKPSLISRALGAAVLKDGVGGTDGRAYWLSAKNGENWELLGYDTHTGLWSRSDEVQVVDFCRVGDDVKFLSGDTVYTIGGGEESVEWEAVFVPMYETLEGGKQYNRLIFRVEVPRDGYLAADVRFDDGRWMQVGVVKGKSGPVSLPIPLRRCDKFQIRLRGKGDCAVLDMVREFRLRGER